MARCTKKKRDVKVSQKEKKADSISYRLKCAKSANGLSHYLMYGDLPKDKSLL